MSEKTTIILKHTCPYCNKVQDMLAPQQAESRIEKGSVSLCYDCLNLFEFDEFKAPRKLTRKIEEDLKESGQWGEIMRMRNKIEYRKMLREWSDYAQETDD